MKTILILSVLAATSLLLAGTYFHEDNSEFEGYIATYGKSYQTESEYYFRKSIFDKNMATINRINSENHSYTLGMNKFGDWTDQEFSQLLGYRSVKPFEKPQNWGQTVTRNEKSIDWTAQGVVAPVKDQGSCGSCWAFSAVGAYESAFAIRCDSGELTEFSEQQLVDCDDLDSGCNSGLMTNAFTYYESNRVCLEDVYPYEGKDASCRVDSQCDVSGNAIEGFKAITSSDPEDIHDNLNFAPHSIAVEADKDVFKFFKDGVIDDDSCGHELNHGVLLAGYIASKDAWKIKNSWGADWGANGYVYIKDNHKVDYGFCGVNMDVSRPNL